MAQFKQKTWYQWRQRIFNVLRPLVFVLICLYLLKQAVWGERGIFTWQTLRYQVYQLVQENMALQQHLDDLEDEADRLSGDDPDAIDQAIRENLPVLRSDEYLILLPKKSEN